MLWSWKCRNASGRIRFPSELAERKSCSVISLKIRMGLEVWWVLLSNLDSTCSDSLGAFISDVTLLGVIDFIQWVLQTTNKTIKCQLKLLANNSSSSSRDFQSTLRKLQTCISTWNFQAWQTIIFVFAQSLLPFRQLQELLSAHSWHCHSNV